MTHGKQFTVEVKMNHIRGRLLVQLSTRSGILYMVLNEACNRASGNIIRKGVIQITGTRNRGHKGKKSA